MSLNLEVLIHSPVCRIRFAGFESDTATLCKAGWDISAEQQHSWSSTGYSVRLALRHQAAQCYMLTHAVDINYGMTMMMKNNRMFTDPNAEFGFGRLPPFNVACIFNDGKVQYMPSETKWQFNPIDPFPVIKHDVQIHDFKDWVPFRTISKDAPQIYVPPSSVPDLMAYILEKQEPKQKEIRERILDEEFRRSREGEFVDPSVRRDSQHGDIRCQILAFGT